MYYPVNPGCVRWSSIVAPKHLAALQALPSAQAQRIHLRVYAQIGISERGKLGTGSKLFCCELVAGNS
jgi:hypothetical protein